MMNFQKLLSRTWILAGLMAGVLVTQAAFKSILGNKIRAGGKGIKIKLPARAAHPSLKQDGTADAEWAAFLHDTKWGVYQDGNANELRWIDLIQKFIVKHPGTLAAGKGGIAIARTLGEMRRYSDEMAVAQDVADKYADPHIHVLALTVKAEGLVASKQIDGAVALLAPLAAQHQGTEEGALAGLGLAKAYGLLGKVKLARKILASAAGSGEISRKTRVRLAQANIRLDTDVSFGRKNLDDSGKQVPLTEKDRVALVARGHSNYLALLQSLGSPILASKRIPASLRKQDPTDQDLANETAFEYGLWLLQNQLYTDAEVAFQALASSSTTGSFVDPSVICVGIAQFYEGRIGQAISTEQTALADPNIDPADIPSAQGWIATMQARLGVEPPPGTALTMPSIARIQAEEAK